MFSAIIKNKRRIFLSSFLIAASLFTAGTAIASMTFNTNTITSDGAINLNPTGQPVTVNGDLTVTGSCTGCGGGGTPGGAPNSIQYNNNGALGGFGSWDGTTLSLVEALPASLGDDTRPFLVGVEYDDPGTVHYRNAGYFYNYNEGTGSIREPQAIYGDLENFGGGSWPTTASVFYAYGENDAPGTAGKLVGFYSDLEGDGTTDTVAAFYSDFLTAGTVTSKIVGTYHDLTLISATVPSIYGTYVTAPGGDPTLFVGDWIAESGGSATSAYAFWSDERGVFRIKADNTFNGVYQAIPALYNPQFTKYTPGATDYERIVMGQWESNVAVITTEKGGTGTLRNIRIGDGNVLTTLGPVTTVSSLPTCNSDVEGARRSVNDANSTTFNAIAAGSGSNHMGVYCNGTNWVISN